jgi:hypothetical protein
MEHPMASPAHLRPDIAQMAESVPVRSGPSSVDMQAAAQRAVTAPYVEFDGSRWYLSHQPDMFDLADLGEAIDAADANPLAALGVINRCLREWLADYPALRARFRAVHGRRVDDAALTAWAELAQGIFEAVAARPTEAPASSSGGRASTSTSSKDDGPSPAPTGDWQTYVRE